MKLLHCFADHGVESEALSGYGDVVRVGIDPRSAWHSEAIAADASDPDTLPFRDGEFDLALLHPPCTRWSRSTSISGDPDDHPDLIDEARAIGLRYAEHYIVENVPGAPLTDPVVLDGGMFGLPIRYERAFETSFRVEQPGRQTVLGETETSPFFYSERSPAWWRSVKGIRGTYPIEHQVKNCLPTAYVDWLVRQWLEATDRSDGVADYSDYEERMDKERAQAVNTAITEY